MLPGREPAGSPASCCCTHAFGCNRHAHGAGVRVPTLVVNSMDDMVCQPHNIRCDLVRETPGYALVRTRRGSHVAFNEGFFGRGCFMVSTRPHASPHTVGGTRRTHAPNNTWPLAAETGLLISSRFRACRQSRITFDFLEAARSTQAAGTRTIEATQHIAEQSNTAQSKAAGRTLDDAGSAAWAAAAAVESRELATIQ